MSPNYSKMLNSARHQPAAPWAEVPINFPKRDTWTPVDFLSYNSSVLRLLESKVAASGARERGREGERVLDTIPKSTSSLPLPPTLTRRNTTTPDFLLVLRKLEAKVTVPQVTVPPEQSLSHKTHTTDKTAPSGALPLPPPLQKRGDGEGGCCSADSVAAAATTTVEGGGGGGGGGVEEEEEKEEEEEEEDLIVFNDTVEGVEGGNGQQELEPGNNSAEGTGYYSECKATQALGTGRSRGAEAYSAGGCKDLSWAKCTSGMKKVPGLWPLKMRC